MRLKLNLDYLLARMWDAMGLIRVYTKRRGCPPDVDEPVVLSSQRHGVTVEAATARISKELLVVFNYAEVWGTSTKHSPSASAATTSSRTRTSSRSSARRTTSRSSTRTTPSASRTTTR